MHIERCTDLIRGIGGGTVCTEFCGYLLFLAVVL